MALTIDDFDNGETDLNTISEFANSKDVDTGDSITETTTREGDTIRTIKGVIADVMSEGSMTYIGEYSNGLEFSDYNEYAIYNGVAYALRTTTSTPYTTITDSPDNDDLSAVRLSTDTFDWDVEIPFNDGTKIVKGYGDADASGYDSDKTSTNWSTTLPDGRIMKGGFLSSPSQGSNSVTFTDEFPNSCDTVTLTAYESGESYPSDEGVGLAAYSTTGFSAITGIASDYDGIHWLAFGY